MNKGDKNWIRLNRSIMDNPLWKSKDPFDCRSAWVDLILLANHKDGTFFASGELIKIPRGSLFTSLEHLSLRWNWSVKKVRGYLKVLSEAQMLVTKGTHRGTLISLINYDIYQGQGQTEGTSEDTSEGISEGIRTRNKEEYKKKRSRPTSVAEQIRAMERMAKEDNNGSTLSV